MVEMVFVRESKRSMVGDVECVGHEISKVCRVICDPPKRGRLVSTICLVSWLHSTLTSLSCSHFRGSLGLCDAVWLTTQLTSAMPWDLLSRLRSPVRRQPTPGPPLQDAVPQPQGLPAPQLQIDRKILQDPSSYLEAEAEPDLPLGLTPSTRLPAAGSSSNARSRPRPPGLSLEPPPRRNELPSGSSAEITPRRSAINRISKIAAGGEWSTFGRKREHGRTSPPDNLKSPSHSPSQAPTRNSKHLSTTVRRLCSRRAVSPTLPSRTEGIRAPARDHLDNHPTSASLANPHLRRTRFRPNGIRERHKDHLRTQLQ
ncbi:hypothetical protein L210DRAFT_3140697 [Boletus edulis BED1]|uniref:Uncharacterized protein n=1 Tax=Boletus edulis BED1 TaxID=1328754 RepID=A0AAD4BXV8_BOLED|nr:hypothetical protein L210DRAFT_3140697 [Boletus edulis BED1]